ncbi:MAG: hypothetical protein LBP79_01920 [Clostridiales bacterium]|jgi:hypothetical protein|nr:hypothetical protein [Clostridiales bacterium]
MNAQEKVSLIAILAQGKDPGNLGEADGTVETEADFDATSPEEIAEAIAMFGDGGDL